MKPWSQTIWYSRFTDQNQRFRCQSSKWCIQESYGTGVDESNPIRKQQHQSNASTQAWREDLQLARILTLLLASDSCPWQWTWSLDLLGS